MRKAIILFVLLFALSLAGMLWAHAALTASQYDVSFTEAASFGDVSAAEGLTVSVRAQLAQHLLWDSRHTFGREPSARTEFIFSANQLNFGVRYTGEVFSLGIGSDFSASATGGGLLSDEVFDSAYSHEFYSFVKILRDVASRTKNGESRTENINFRDYYEYYPIAVNFSHGSDYMYYFAHNGGERYISQLPDEAEIREAFSEYFKLPVPEKHMISVGITKDSTGNVVEVSTSQGRPVWIYAESVETGHGVYFTLHTGGVTDFSGIGGGYGIYLLPASTIYDDEGKELPTLDYNSLSTAYPLDESVSVQRLTLSEDGSCLNLITVENDTLYLTVIELSSMTEKQKLPLLGGMGEIWLQTVCYADGIMFALLSDSRFVLVELSDDNTGRIALTDKRNDELLNEGLFKSGYFRWYEPVAAWDGARLALITATSRFVPQYDGYSAGYSYDACGFALEIFDAGGLKYKGIYESSLDVLATREDYNGRCRPADTGNLALNW